MAAAMILFVALLGGHRSPITGHFGLTGQSLLSTFIMTPAPQGQQALRERAAAERAEHARAADVAVADGAPERRPRRAAAAAANAAMDALEQRSELS